MSTALVNDVRTAAGLDAPLRLVALVRISKDRDDETSTRTQPYEINQWAQAHGMCIVETFTEVARSGFKNIPRPKLDDAMAMVRNGLADGIIVWKIDRFTRKGAKEIFRMLSMIGTGGFLIATHDAIDTRGESMADIIKLTVIAEVAKAESEAKAQRAASWHRDRLRGTEGVPQPPNGKRPYGYVRPRANVLAVKESEAVEVRKMATTFLAGGSLRGIVRDLSARDVPKDGDSAWNHRAVRHILMNPVTAGMRNVEGELRKGAWTPILDAETWRQVCARLDDPARTTVPPARLKHRWLLTGIATCGKDGGSLRMKPHVHGPRYSCRVCGMSIEASVADEKTEAVVLELLAGDGWKALRAQGRKHDANSVDFLTQRLAHARKRWIAGKVTDEEWDTTHDEINAMIVEIQAAPIVELPPVDDLEAAWPDMDTMDKRQVIIAATESITILPYGKGVIGFDRVEVM